MLIRNDWNKDVKKAINDLLSDNDSGYAVFDFDNTCSIFDCALVTFHDQIERMAFELTPSKLLQAISNGISKLEIYNDYLYDINQAYSYLYEKYGPFSSQGVDLDHNDPYYSEFMVKMFYFYGLIYTTEGPTVGDAWVLSWLTNMTEQEVYDLSYRALETRMNQPTRKKTWKTSGEIPSRVGVLEHSFVDGISVTENIQELWKELSSHHIDVWVATASPIHVVQAAIDLFGLHPYCTGLIGLTNKLVNGKYIPEYDYVTGYPYLAQKEWHKEPIPSKSIVQEQGKVTAIQNILVPRYHSGPLAGFMDSQGDFNFCTEFNSLKLVVCFNRADRSFNDGGGLIAEVAMMQKEYHYDYFHRNGDTYYVLQGRDENGLRKFIDSESTIVYESKELKKFKDERNEQDLNYFITHQLSTQEVLNQYSIIYENHGFLKEYDGYHSK